jgi:hypothetical protein
MVPDDAGEWVREQDHRDTVERVKKLEGALQWFRDQFEQGRSIRALDPAVPTLVEVAGGFESHMVIESSGSPKVTE